MSTAKTTANRQMRVAVLTAATAAVALGAMLVLVPISARATSIDPVLGDAAVQVRETAHLRRSTLEGSLAVGGAFTFTGPAEVTGDLYAQGGGAASGPIDWMAASGTLDVGGSVRLGSATGTGIDDSGPSTVLTPTSAVPAAPSLVSAAGDQAADVVDPALDVRSRFDAAGSGYAAVSAALAGCAADVEAVYTRSGRRATLTLEPGTNVWTVDVADFDRVRGLVLVPMPSASTRLVVNVTGIGSGVDLPRIDGVNPLSAAPYVLYNLTGSGSLTLTHAGRATGTVYAPGRSIRHDSLQPLRGMIIADSYVAGPPADDDGEGPLRTSVIGYPFDGGLACGGRPTEETTSPTSTSGIVMTSADPTTTSASSETTVSSASSETTTISGGSTVTPPETTDPETTDTETTDSESTDSESTDSESTDTESTETTDPETIESPTTTLPVTSEGGVTSRPVPSATTTRVAGASTLSTSSPSTTTAGDTSATVAGASGTSTTGSVITRLGRTGVDVVGMLVAAFGLLAAGIGLVSTSRRQQRGRHVH